MQWHHPSAVTRLGQQPGGPSAPPPSHRHGAGLFAEAGECLSLPGGHKVDAGSERSDAHLGGKTVRKDGGRGAGGEVRRSEE